MRLLRTIRFDDTDERVFERAAEPGEWAVPGGFVFSNDTPETLTGRRYQAFRRGFLGLSSFGWSTFVQVAPADEALFEELARILAAHFVEHWGAPDLEAALPVARRELRFAASVAEHPPGTVVALERTLSEEGVRERFRVVHAGGFESLKVFAAVPEEGEEGP